MKRMVSVARDAVAIMALSLLLVPVAALAQLPQNGSTNSPLSAIPTLGDVGLASLAGVLLIGGAWLLSSRRPRK